MILSAFDNFKLVHREKHRFETLMYYFRHYEDFNVDFMVACMQVRVDTQGHSHHTKPWALADRM